MAKLFVFSGAGISAESGVQTFRDKDGLWEGHKISEVATYHTWKQNFDKVHEFYNARRLQLGTVQPNAAHLMVADWHKRYEVVNITQNVDDLFERAGCPDVIHVHGSLTSMKCTACGHVWEIGYAAWDTTNTCAKPLCLCKKGVKPNVVFFGEGAPRYADLYSTLKSLTVDDVVVVIGTSSQVVNIAELLDGSHSFNILNNLCASENALINEAEEVAFDRKFFMPVSQALEGINALVRERLD